MTGATMRGLAAGLLLVGCGGKEQDFDVEAYCVDSVPCVNEARAGYSSSGFEITVDGCIFQWESERDLYTDAGCGLQWDDLEYCFANEELSCVFGSWASTSCLSELRDVQVCVEENLFAETSYR